MANATKVIVAHDLHRFSIELENAFLDGWRMKRDVAARRSISNRFTVTVEKEISDEAVGKVFQEPEAPSEAVDQVAANVVENADAEKTKVETETETEAEKEVEAPKKSNRKKAVAKVEGEAE